VIRDFRGCNKVVAGQGFDMGDTIIFKEESYRLMGACFEVYKNVGSGFLEAVYQECLGLELGLQNIPFAERSRIGLKYKGQDLKQHYEPDFLCFGKIIVEIKAVKQLGDEHRAQVINYLKATGLELGLLVNFGHHPRLEHERFMNQHSTGATE
jgi:GxxExxY protein